MRTSVCTKGFDVIITFITSKIDQESKIVDY